MCYFPSSSHTKHTSAHHLAPTRTLVSAHSLYPLHKSGL
jgi:hypothetical protein